MKRILLAAVAALGLSAGARAEIEERAVFEAAIASAGQSREELGRVQLEFSPALTVMSYAAPFDECGPEALNDISAVNACLETKRRFWAERLDVQAKKLEGCVATGFGPFESFGLPPTLMLTGGCSEAVKLARLARMILADIEADRQFVDAYLGSPSYERIRQLIERKQKLLGELAGTKL